VANFPLAVTRHHFINTCGGTKTSPLDYTGRATLTARFRSDYCSYVILSVIATWTVDGWVVTETSYGLGRT